MRARQVRAATLLAAAATLLAGCADDPVSAPAPDGVAESRAAARRAPQAQRGPMGLDGVFHDIGGRVRGFAGFYVDADGTVNVMLVDRAQNGLARREVSDFLQRTRGRALGHMKVKQAKYDFRQLYRWKDAIVAASPDVGITALGICEEQNRLCAGVFRGGGLGAARALAQRLGIPADAIHIVESDPVQPRKLLTEVFSPVPGGVLITSGCTLGFNALYGGQRVFLTAAHCTAEFGDASPPTLFGQPNTTRQIGVESYDPAPTTCTYNARNYACRFSDAAEVAYDDTVAVSLGRIARPHFNTITVDPNNPTFRIIGERQFPYLGETVSFVGRSSGWREGPVNATCIDITMNFTAPNGLTVRLHCQDRFGVGNLGGDSGAPVFHRTATPGDVYLAGILNGGDGAGNSYYSSMRQIEASDNFGDYQTVGP